jgi:hypothetical protein
MKKIIFAAKNIQQRDSPCLVLVPFKHETSKSECRQTKKKNYEKITNICVTRNSNPANGAKTTFET